MLFVAGLGMLQPLGASGQSLSAKDVVVFDNADSPVPYRIPAIAQTRRGTLLAACDYRISKMDVGWSSDEGLFQVNVVMRTSNDHGRTW